jgi:hypothetical protein
MTARRWVLGAVLIGLVVLGVLSRAPARFTPSDAVGTCGHQTVELADLPGPMHSPLAGGGSGA